MAAVAAQEPTQEGCCMLMIGHAQSDKWLGFVLGNDSVQILPTFKSDVGQTLDVTIIELSCTYRKVYHPANPEQCG